LPLPRIAALQTLLILSVWVCGLRLALQINDVAPIRKSRLATTPGVKMTTLELRLNLPDRLAKDAAQMGLLESDSLQNLLREAVRARRISQLALARQRVADAGIESISLEEIQDEVDAHRLALRNQAAS
jgi:hypothetical protein